MMATAAQQSDLIPREPRQSCRVETVIMDDCGRELAAWLGNISEHGFMADCEEKLPLGVILDIRLPDRGMVRAQVRWAVGWRFGALILD